MNRTNSTSFYAPAPPIAQPAPAPCRLSYAEFEQEIRKTLAAQGWSTQRQANVVSTLNNWRGVLGLDKNATIGDELTTSFQQKFRCYQDELATRLAPRTQKDRQEHLLLIRRLYEALTIQDLLPATFHEALAYAVAHSGLSVADVARESGIRRKVLEDWMAQTHIPNAPSIDHLPALERSLRLPSRALLSRLPLRRHTRYERDRDTAASTLARRAQCAKSQQSSAGPRRLPPTQRLKQQWLGLIRFKADLTREGATLRNSWRLKPVDKVGFRIQWHMLCDGLVCATASVHWSFFSSYLAYLSRPSPGKRPVEGKFVDTLAWLAVIPEVKSYVQHLRLSAGNMTHNGVITFIASVRSHLRKQTGYLWLCPEFADDLAEAGVRFAVPIAAASPAVKRELWQRHCESAYQDLLALDKSIGAQSQVRCSRRPDSRVEALLADPFPLKALVRGIRALEEDIPPQAHHRDYVAWIRDVLLLKMLVSNPLRIAQYAAMRIRGPESNLRRTSDGHWRLQFEPEAFKNEKGAAHERYDVALEPSVTPWLHRYFSESRPYLVGADSSDYLFLPAVEGPRRGAGYEKLGLEPTGVWNSDAMAARVKLVTARYLPDTPGFGPQAFRHVVATDHLKRHPQDYLTVAQLLHDTLATVIKAYAHLRVDDGLRTLHSGVAQATAELEEERGAR